MHLDLAKVISLFHIVKFNQWHDASVESGWTLIQLTFVRSRNELRDRGSDFTRIPSLRIARADLQHMALRRS